MKFIDLTGKRFGKLMVVSLNCKGKHSRWNCICDCGVEKTVIGSHLTTGKIKSCGCISRERIANLNKKHLLCNTRLYSIWAGIKSRCNNYNNCSYKNYGGRGISVCEQWQNDFVLFYNWATENGYRDDLTIDRIDTNGDYEPENCRWVDREIQSNNTRNTIIVRYENKDMSLKQLSKIINVNYKKLHRGFYKFNFDIAKAIEYAKTYKKKEK